MDAALPQLVADTFAIHVNDDPTPLAVLANDQFAGYDGPKRITALSFPTAGGAAEISDDGSSVVFRPAADFSGDDTFSYVVDNQWSAQVTVRVVSPLADDSLTVYPDGLAAAIDVLANDPFWAGYTGQRRITGLSATQLGGTVSIAADGRSVSYELPDDPAALGQTDHFSYLVDGRYIADVEVSLFNPLFAVTRYMPQNGDPIEIAPLSQSNFDSWGAYAGPRLLTAVHDAEPGASMTILPNGRTIRYQPPPDFIGADTFTYVVDGRFASTVTVQVAAATATDYVTVDQDAPGALIDVLANDVYYESGWTSQRLATQVTAVTQGEHGQVEIVDGGLLVRYIPAAGFAGTDSFAYTANGRYTGRVSVYVTRPVRDDYFPGAGTSIVANSQDNLLDVLANDFYQGGTHAVTAVGGSAHGAAITIRDDGQRILYTPQSGFTGSDTFSYTVDGQFTAEVSVWVQSPAASFNVELEPARGQVYRIDLAGHLPDLARYSGAALITSASTASANATVTISADGRAVFVTSSDLAPVTISYTLDGKYTGSIYASFRMSRFLGASSLVAEQNQPGPLDVLASAPWQYQDYYRWQSPVIHYQGPRLITDVFGARHGTVSVAADGKTVIYQPHADFVGQDSFQYLVDGHELGSATVQVVRRVRDDQFRVAASSQDSILGVTLNDQLGGGYTGMGLITAITAPAHGIARISDEGRSIAYTPRPGYSGADSVTYTVDGHLKATVAIRVAADAQSQFPKFESLAALKVWLIESALESYRSLFGQPGWGSPIYYDDMLYLTASSGSTRESAGSHSQTNVQVAGIDEADLSEVDGQFLYVLSGGKLVITRAGADSLTVASETAIAGTAVGIYLDGDRLTVISRSGGGWFGPVPHIWPTRWGREKTTVTVFDVSDRGQPTIVEKTVIDGANVDSRKIGNLVYLVLDHASNNLALPAPQIVGAEQSVGSLTVPRQSSPGRYETEEEYVARVESHFGEILDSILPHFQTFGADGALARSGILLVPEEIGRPLDESDQSLLSVVTIDTAGSQPGIVASTGILTVPGGTLYMNHDSLYLLRQQWGGEGQATDIVKFSLDSASGVVTAQARGQVPGFILNQFSVDEAGGFLRVATTVNNAFADDWSRRAENDVWVLRADGDLLELVGSLQNLAHGESIRSVRYLGNRALITTFPTTQYGIDPVYAIDLADPTQPRFVGELTLPGFSQYMQFIDEEHVLTVGVNAPTGGGGWAPGLPLQVSLFDVSDFAHPRLIDQVTLARLSTSLAQQDHHAFGWFAEFGLLALPVAHSYTKREDLDGDGFREAVATVHADEVQYFRINTSGQGRGVQLAGTIELDTAALRSAFIDDTLYSIGDGQIVASSVDDPGTPLASVTWEVPPTSPPGPIVWPIDIMPIEITLPRLTSHTSLYIPGNQQPPAVPTEAENDLVEWLQAARDDLAARLGVAPASALVVSVEAGQGSAGTTQVVLRSGEHNLLYRGNDDGTAELVDADFVFPSSKLAVAQGEPVCDVNRDGAVSPTDAVRVINDLLRHNGMRRADGATLRQLTAAAASELDVDRDGLITPRDALLVIHALIRRPPVSSVASPAAGLASPQATVAASTLAAGDFNHSAVAIAAAHRDEAVDRDASAAAIDTSAPVAFPPQTAVALSADHASDPHDAVLAATDDWFPWEEPDGPAV